MKKRFAFGLVCSHYIGAEFPVHKPPRGQNHIETTKLSLCMSTSGMHFRIGGGGCWRQSRLHQVLKRFLDYSLGLRWSHGSSSNWLSSVSRLARIYCTSPTLPAPLRAPVSLIHFNLSDKIKHIIKLKIFLESWHHHITFSLWHGFAWHRFNEKLVRNGSWPVKMSALRNDTCTNGQIYH